MTKARELADLIANVNNGSSLAAKNFIQNGAMNVSQRGTSFSFAHDGITNAYTLDRFAFIVQNTDEFDGTVTQSSDVPSGKGFANSLKWTTGTAESALASNEVAYIEHKVEAQNVAGLRYGTADAKPVTLSFWVKSSITGTFNTGIYQSDGSRIMTKTYTISSANTWEYKTLTFAGDTSGTINDDNGEGLRPIWNIFAGGDYTSSDSTSWGSYSTATWAYGHTQNTHATTAGATFFLTGVQLEIGKATAFEHEPYSVTLQKCLRYYQKHVGWITQFNRGLDSNYDAHVVNNGVGVIGFMRATPTETIDNVYRWDAGDSNWTSDSTAFSAAISSSSQTFVEGYYGRQDCNAVKADWELISEL